jgi:hypothetical protein
MVVGLPTADDVEEAHQWMGAWLGLLPQQIEELTPAEMSGPRGADQRRFNRWARVLSWALAQIPVGCANQWTIIQSHARRCASGCLRPSIHGSLAAMRP